MGVRVEFDKEAAKKRIEARLARVQLALDIQVLKDSNLEVPQTNERTLLRSGIVESGGGAISWNTPYARRQYYLDEEVDRPSEIKYTTPGTHYKWFEWAKAKRLKVWEEIANREYNR